MSELELLLLDQTENCTVYTIQFLSDNLNEFEKFVEKFQSDGTLNSDFRIIAKFIDQILDFGALERYFRPEGKIKDSVVALPTLRSKLRLYGLRLSDKILILGNGGVKKTRTYNEDDNLKGYVLTLQRFEELLKDGVKNGTIVVTENEIITDKTFNLWNEQKNLFENSWATFPPKKKPKHDSPFKFPIGSTNLCMKKDCRKSNLPTQLASDQVK